MRVVITFGVVGNIAVFFCAAVSMYCEIQRSEKKRESSCCICNCVVVADKMHFIQAQNVSSWLSDIGHG